MAFYRCCQTTRVHFMALEGINRTAWGTRLLLTAVLASLVDSTSLCHILRAQHCCLSPNGCFSPPLASHPPPTPLPPTHPLLTQSVILQALKKSIQKTSSIQVACRNSYEMIASYITTLIIQDIWCDRIKPPEKHRAFNIEIHISRNTK